MATTIRVKIAVREIAELVWRSGDLGSRDGLRASAIEGIRGHRWLQSTRPAGYRPEVPLELVCRRGSLELVIGGRADGVFEDADPPVVEEIKTTVQPLMLIGPQTHPLHLVQAKLYAALLARKRQLPVIVARVTYLQLDTREVRSFDQRFEATELDAFLDDTTERYGRWLEQVIAWRHERDRAARAAPFPHATYRAGQGQLVAAVSRTVAESGRLFCQAPTGIGKTAATLYGAARVLETAGASQLLFLTAKTTGRRAAEQAVAELGDAGLPLKSLTLVARAKICPYPDSQCAPGDCPVAAGHFDRIHAATAEVFEARAIDRELLLDTSAAHRVCPFQLGLTLAPWVDVVIGDYNYAFDPRVSPKVMQAPTLGRRVFLVDEAHNLIDRAREMFSAALGTREVRSARRARRGSPGALLRAIERLGAALEETCKAALEGAGKAAVTGLSDQLLDAIDRLISATEPALRQPGPRQIEDEVLELYFRATAFARLAAQRADRHSVFAARRGRDLRIKIYCVDPAADLSAIIDGRAAVFFSGTLSPLPYFARVLGGEAQDPLLGIDGPFPPENLWVGLADRLSTRLRDRRRTLGETAELIEAAIASRPGNYLVYLPSYEYLRAVTGELERRGTTIRFAVQTPRMSEEERERFLARFEAADSEPAIGFAVLGGAFGEAIDLVGERLTGVVIVGVGLPGISPERELIRGHFDEDEQRGFAFAYQYPGMSRVLQAAGRVIRSETDRGMVLLIGERFADPAYGELLPAAWGSPARVREPADLETSLGEFWGSPDER